MVSANKITLDIATDLAAGDNDLLLFSTDGVILTAIVTISGLVGVLGAIDLTESYDGLTFYEISGAQIAVPANGSEKVNTLNGCGLVFGGIRIDKGAATAGTIVIEANSKQ